MAKKQTTSKVMEIRIFLDQYGFFKLKAKGDPMQMAEGLGSLMVQNPMLKDVVKVATEVCNNYDKIEKESMEKLQNETVN